jgi:hypothetical protein
LTGAGGGYSAAAEAAGGEPSSRPRVDALATAVFALLVAACVGAFFLTQRLKHTPTAVQRFERTPTFSPRSATAEQREEHISFKLAHPDSVTVAIVDSNLNVVATLVRDYPLPRYKQFSLRWNGRRGTAHGYRALISESGHRSVLPRIAGPLAPPGEYRVRVELHGQGREVLSPWSFTLKGGGG